MNALTLARQVRELLAVPERWTQGTSAASADGRRLPSGHPEACCWCLIGAMTKCSYGARLDDLLHLERAIRADLGVSGIDRWNDAPNRTHADVLALLDRVVERMERDGAQP